VRSVLLISEPIAVGRRKTESYALRSTAPSQAVPHHLLYKGQLLGEEDSLFFLGSSTPVGDEVLGNVFRIFIPDRVVFGYGWMAHDVWQIDSGVELRLRLYERRYSPADGYSRTFRVRIRG
jgi:hypothetical protein